MRLELLANQNQSKATKLAADVANQNRRIAALENSLGIQERMSRQPGQSAGGSGPGKTAD
jgi:hypothetical protein